MKSKQLMVIGILLSCIFLLGGCKRNSTDQNPEQEQAVIEKVESEALEESKEEISEESSVVDDTQAKEEDPFEKYRDILDFDSDETNAEADMKEKESSTVEEAYSEAPSEEQSIERPVSDSEQDAADEHTSEEATDESEEKKDNNTLGELDFSD